LIESPDLPNSRWQAGPSDDFVWAEFDGDYVAFHRPSGKTHLLNPVSEALLTEILREPQGLDAVVAALGGAPKVGEVEYIAEIVEILDRFEELGLVVRW
jgi:PqqD family protein of HPr-rel-A system